MHDDDTDDLDFAMLTPPTRPGPCKAASAPEVDSVEADFRRNLERGGYRMLSFDKATLTADIQIADVKRVLEVQREAVEVRHGSGKVKV